MSSSPHSGLRADARANREHLLQVAGTLFAERGLEAPLYLVAKGADVGPATLYRHFPDRHALLEALAWRAAEMFDEVARAAAEMPTGWEKIVTYLDGVIDLNIRAPWHDAVTAYARRHSPQEWVAGRWEQEILAAVGQAQSEGSVRIDVVATDLVFLPLLLTRLLSYPEPVRSTVLARHRALMLDSLRPVGADRPGLDQAPLPVELLNSLTRPNHHTEAGTPPA